MSSCTYIANICRQESFQGGQMSLPLITENIPKYTSAASFAVFYSHCLLNGYEKDIDKQTWIDSIIVFNVLINILQFLADHKQNQLQNLNLGQNPMYHYMLGTDRLRSSSAESDLEVQVGNKWI